MSQCVWLTGRAGAGKTTVGRAVTEQLRARHEPVVLIDDEEVRAYLAGTGGTSVALTWLCRLLVTSGVTTVVAVSMPGRDDRERLRDEIPGFIEAYLDAPPEICEARIGRADDYEEPFAADLRVPTFGREPAASAAQVLSFLGAEDVT